MNSLRRSYCSTSHKAR